MNENDFVEAHAKICFSAKKSGGSPARGRWCGRRLFYFLKERNLPLDIYYNQKLFPNDKEQG